MKTDLFYRSTAGRALMIHLQTSGFFSRVAGFLRSGASRCLIPGYIRRHRIDMRPFEKQKYRSFAEFFHRRKTDIRFVSNPDVLISPCDALLTIYRIHDDLVIPMKGSRYNLSDLLPQPDVHELFRGGLCMVFRLEATDYHRFCCFDDAKIVETRFIPGQLHSVQPIACRKYPVYRLNRRWYSILDTAHFGTAAQIEVGAMFVGGVEFTKDNGSFLRGEDMGSFELAGSTLVLLLNASAWKQLTLFLPFLQSLLRREEVRVSMGEGIGILGHA